MKTRSTVLLLVALGMALLGWPSAASARSKDEVLGGIKARYPTLVELLAAHKVGETGEGQTAAVKSGALGDKVKVQGKTMTIGQFIQAENADRTEYFQIVAKATNTSPQVVAKNFAQHRYSLLKTGEYWKPVGGGWTQKK